MSFANHKARRRITIHSVLWIFCHDSMDECKVIKEAGQMSIIQNLFCLRRAFKMEDECF